jgi:hypothetical protein
MVTDLGCLMGADSKGGSMSNCRASLSNFLTTEYTEHTDKMEPNRRAVRFLLPCVLCILWFLDLAMSDFCGFHSTNLGDCFIIGVFASNPTLEFPRDSTG